MNAEERQRWDALIADYDRADQAVETEERFVDIERRQVEAHHHRVQGTTNDQKEAEYRSAFTDYLLHGVTGISAESRTAIEARAGISGLSGGVIIPRSLASSIEVALKSYGGMFEAGQIFTTSKGDDLTLPTIDDTSAKATIVAEYQQSTKRAPSFGSVLLKAHTYRTPIIPVSLELLQDSAFDQGNRHGRHGVYNKSRRNLHHARQPYRPYSVGGCGICAKREIHAQPQYSVGTRKSQG